MTINKIKGKKVLIKSQQNGVVLIVALIFLVALTAVAAALMQNTTTDMKMSGASEIREVAIQDAVSAIDEVIFNQISLGQNNLFDKPLLGNFPEDDQTILLPGSQSNATAVVEGVISVPCGFSTVATSTDITCNKLRININKTYGRNGNSNIIVSAGIEQQIL
jgi:hypothetical protein